jgi:hypothetical protein
VRPHQREAEDAHGLELHTLLGLETSFQIIQVLTKIFYGET